MWFLIRSVFWLSIVFALLPWPDNSGFGLSLPAGIWFRTRDIIGAAIGKARTASEKVCTDSPLACLGAARLGQFAADRRADISHEASAAARPAAAAGSEVGLLTGQYQAFSTGPTKAPSAPHAKAPLTGPPSR
jgi:hypothetical protein